MVETACQRKSASNNELLMLFHGFRESGQFLQLLRSVTGQCELVMTHLLENQEVKREGEGSGSQCLRQKLAPPLGSTSQ